MALDTANGRASAININLPWRGLLPIPDGAIDQADRQQVAFFYRGIAAAAAVEITPSAERTVFVASEDRIVAVPDQSRVSMAP